MLKHKKVYQVEMLKHKKVYQVEMLKHKKVYQVEMFGDFVKKILSAALRVQVELDGAAVQQGNVDNHCFQLKRKDQNTKFL